MSDQLSELRRKIDGIDNELLKLLNERTSIAREIGAIKSREGLPVYAADREAKLLKCLLERSQGPLGPDAVRAIYREIMSAALAVENDVPIACVGPFGSPSHQAALGKFGSSVRYAVSPDISGVFDEVSAGRAECGVVPLADQALDALAKGDFSICAEASSTSSPGARFLVLGKKPNQPSGHDRTMIMLHADDVGSFKKSGTGWSFVASRPALGSGVFIFAEADGHADDLAKSELFRDLSKKCRSVKVLGSYPINGSARA